MNFNDMYAHSFELLASNKDIHKTIPAFGYTSNIDLICNNEIGHLNHLIQRYIKMQSGKEPRKYKKADNISELLETVVAYALDGLGGEVLISNSKFITDHFCYKEAVGGTAAQAAMALSRIGRPSLVHLTDNSDNVCNILNSKYLYTVNDNQQLIHTSDVLARRRSEYHIVYQFTKGDKINLNNKLFTIPFSNRVIFNMDHINSSLPLDLNYFQYINDNALDISSIVISGLNVLNDIQIAKERCAYLINQIRKYKYKNPKGIVFYEEAFFHNQDVHRYIKENLFNYIDIVSMNEEEAGEEDLNRASSIQNIVSLAEEIKIKYGIKKGVIVHARDYSFYVGEKLLCDIAFGLCSGNILAAGKALTGSYITIDELPAVKRLKISSVGLQLYSELKKINIANSLTFIPARYIASPRHTIGLGDTFIAGVQICFEG